MTSNELLAACAWPVFLLLTVLLKAVRGPVLSRWIGLITTLYALFCFILLMVFGQSSLVAVFDLYFIVVVLGSGLVWRGLRDLLYFIPDLKTKLRACALVLLGGAIAFFPTWIFFQDIFLPRLVLEGRVQNVRVVGKRGDRYVADIAGHTVNVTTPIFEELKLLPVVRLEVGRGSDYVYKFEHITD